MAKNPWMEAEKSLSAKEVVCRKVLCSVRLMDAGKEGGGNLEVMCAEGGGATSCASGVWKYERPTTTSTVAINLHFQKQKNINSNCTSNQ